MKLIRYAAALLLLTSTAAFAESGNNPTVPNNPIYKEECGSCHVLYLPRLLTGDNWGRIMDDLDHHFGMNASVGAQENKNIRDFLMNNASHNERQSSDKLRITQTPWWKERHERQLRERIFSSAPVKSRSNCIACHANIERDKFVVWGVTPRPGWRVFDDTK
jgi:hypothetical protein